jgi:hypothetical protein
MRLLLAVFGFASPFVLPALRPLWAGTLADQLTVGKTIGSPASPRTAFISDKATGMNSASDAISVTYDATVTRDSGAPAPVGSPFRDRGGTIFRGGLGLDWQVSSKWAVIVAANGSPPSTTSTSTAIPFQDINGVSTPLAGDLRVRASSLGGELSAEYDTVDSLPIELILSATGGLLSYATSQKLLKLQLANNTTISAAALEKQCQTGACSPELQTALAAASPGVLQAYATLDVTAVVHRTDIGIATTGFGYSSDPTQLGYFGVAAFGRGPTTGDGTAFAPVRLAVRPHLLFRVGHLRLGASGEYDRYVDELGSSFVASAKPAYDLTSTLRVWVTLCLQLDDAQGAPSHTLSGAVGVRWAY